MGHRKSRGRPAIIRSCSRTPTASASNSTTSPAPACLPKGNGSAAPKCSIRANCRKSESTRLPERRRGALPSEVEAATLRFSLRSNESLVFARGDVADFRHAALKAVDQREPRQLAELFYPGRRLARRGAG